MSNQQNQFDYIKNELRKDVKESDTAFIVIRADRSGEDAIELVFSNLEAAKKYAAFENDKSKWPDETYLVRGFKIHSK